MAEKETKLTPELEKLLKVFRADNIITPDEIEQLLAGLVTIIETFQAKSVQLNTELETKLQAALQAMASEHNAVLTQLEDGRQVTQENATTLVNQLIDRANKRIDKLIKEVKAMVPEKGDPGKDADENAVIEAVLQRIKLPEFKQEFDSGENIVDKINALDTKAENQIDAKHIKNLPKPVVNNFGGGGGGIKGVTSDNFTIIDDPTYAGHKRISIPIQATEPDNPFEGMLWIDNS